MKEPKEERDRLMVLAADIAEHGLTPIGNAYEYEGIGIDRNELPEVDLKDLQAIARLLVEGQ